MAVTRSGFTDVQIRSVGDTMHTVVVRPALTSVRGAMHPVTGPSNP